MTSLLLPKPEHQKLQQVDILQIVPLLTVVVLLIKTIVVSSYWHLQLLTEVLCLAGFLFPYLRRSPGFWGSVAAVLGWTVFSHWEDADNHHYVFCYVSLALASVFSLPESQQRRGLRIAAQVLIGLCMGFAVFWKVIAPDYLTNAFFEYALLTDSRFAFFAEGIARISTTDLADNRQLESLLMNGWTRSITLNAVRLTSSESLVLLGQFLTWWTIVIEGILALLFLLPGVRTISFLRNTLLLGFAVTTYAVATVYGFAWMLLILGLAQCRDDEPIFSRLYLGAFLLVGIYKTIPSGHIIALVGWM